MALGLPKDPRGQILFVLTFVALAAGYVYWDMDFFDFLRAPRAQHIAELSSERDSLQTTIERARREIAGRTQKELDARVEAYQAALDTMRRLVPAGNEVSILIDYVTTRAKVRGVELARFRPLPKEAGTPPPFDTYRYELAALGHYDAIGEFLSDVGSLPRIMVPYDVSLKPATAQARAAVSDTSGALLEARFHIRTFVKPAAPPEASRATTP